MACKYTISVIGTAVSEMPPYGTLGLPPNPRHVVQNTPLYDVQYFLQPPVVGLN